MTISESWEFQRTLSAAQATPIVGPLLVSPVKAVVSIAQLIVGTVGSIFFGFLAALTFNDRLGELAFKSLCHTGMGFLGLLYSASNFLSLGIIGHNIENMNKRSFSVL